MLNVVVKHAVFRRFSSMRSTLSVVEQRCYALRVTTVQDLTCNDRATSKYSLVDVPKGQWREGEQSSPFAIFVCLVCEAVSDE